jgi:nitroimidazol reductase NimA-like FMN-containing flavoprotein (pyridoxamine 5'-phosphate oxidase superfamily)
MEPRRRRPPFKGYGLAEDETGMLAWSWATERLEQARNYWVSTTRPDGRPHAMPVWGIWLDDAFFFGSGRDSAKARNLAANPAIVVHLESGDETMILEGRAEQVLDDALEKRVDEVYGRKYDFTPDSSGETDPWFVVRPRRAYAWAERNYTGSATQFDFD